LSLALPSSPHQALRLLASLLTVLVVVLLGALGAGDPPRPAYHHYVALGDSYTAAPFVPLTDVAYGCYRSINNYPHLVASALHIEDLRDRSCSGAQTSDLTSSQDTVRGMTVPPQLSALSDQTDLVTVGIGANNFHLYARMATVCRLMTRICRLHDQRRRLEWIVGQLHLALVPALEQVRARAPHARVLLVGYPKLLPTRGDCRLLPRFRPQDRATFRQVNRRLRDEMAAAARAAGVEFVDFYRASVGHDICSDDPWIQGRNGNAHRGAALHPLPAGQAALARLIERTLRREPPTDRPSPVAPGD
jgi:lysophospholipase L1-like esterase